MILEGNSEVSKIFCGSSEVSKVYLGNTEVFGGGEQPEEPEILYYLYFNQKTRRVVMTRGEDCEDWISATMDVGNATTPGTGAFYDTGNIMSKWPFKDIKPCLVQNGTLIGYLNPNNYAEFENGTPADITSGTYDVMVQLPRIYYKLESDWDGTCSITGARNAHVGIYISNKPQTGYVCNSHMKNGVEYKYIYVSAYENQVSNGNLYVCSGKTPSSDVSHRVFLNTIGNYRNSQYTTFNYHISTYLFILEMLLFGERRNDSIFGSGLVGTVNDILNTGTLNTSGMFFGISSLVTPSPMTGHKIFGLENLMGNTKTYIDGILFDSQGQFLVIDPSNPTSTLSFLGTNYNGYTFSLSYTNFEGNTSLCAVDNAYGFLPVSSVSASTGKQYYETVVKIAPPSAYQNITANPDQPSMVFYYGGYYPAYSGFVIRADVEYNESDTHISERVVCYPTSQIDTSQSN